MDGNDVIACSEAAERAIARARAGSGPTLLEFHTMRWRGHVGPKWDIGVGQRTQEEIDFWIGKCPIVKLRKYLLEKYDTEKMSDTLDSIDEEIEVAVSSALTHARTSAQPDASTLLDNVFAK